MITALFLYCVFSFYAGLLIAGCIAYGEGE
jgi:hypothetical protein